MSTKVNVKFPNEISGLLAWWDANDLKALSNGTIIDSWSDKSGNGYVFNYNTLKSVKQTDSNGYTVLAGGGRYNCTIDLGSTKQPFTFFIVFKANSVGYNIVLSTYDGGSNFLIAGNGTSFITLYYQNFPNPLGNYDIINRHQLNTVVSAIPSERVQKFDGIEYPVVANTITTLTGLSLNWRNSDGNYGLTDYYEIIIYNRKLSNNEIRLMERYLKFKWGLQ